MVDIPQTGDAVRLFQTLLNATWMGIVSDADTPPMMSATLEAVEGDAVITTDVLVGPKGDKGDPAPIVTLHWPAPADSGSLPNDWDADKINHGFWIGGIVYVWDGATWRNALPGPAGPVGPTPLITPTCEAIPPNQAGSVLVTGTSLQPHYHFKIPAPAGPPGPVPAVEGLTNYDTGTTKSTGKVLTVLSDGRWGASSFAAKHPHLYTIPEQAFTNYSGVTLQNARVPILSYTIEAQDYDWVPYVTGHFKAFGLELDEDPTIIGSEVRLGDAVTGQLIGRGFGNTSNWSTVLPHVSESGDPTAAISPGNGKAVVSAGQTADIHVALRNDGLIAGYIFNRAGAQLSILTVPVS